MTHNDKHTSTYRYMHPSMSFLFSLHCRCLAFSQHWTFCSCHAVAGRSALPQEVCDPTKRCMRILQCLLHCRRLMLKPESGYCTTRREARGKAGSGTRSEARSEERSEGRDEERSGKRSETPGEARSQEPRGAWSEARRGARSGVGGSSTKRRAHLLSLV